MGNNVIYENRTKRVEVWTEDYLRPMPHLHKELEIIYVEKGTSHLIVDNSSHTITDGDVFVCFPNQVHCYESSSPGIYHLFTIVSDCCYGLKNILEDSMPSKNVLKLSREDEIIKTLLAAVEFNGEFKETFQAGAINKVLALILQQISVTPRTKKTEGTLQNIINYCTLNFNRELTLDDMADELHLSKYHISHLLNKKLGISFNGYINILRTDNSCELLRKTDKSIARISEESGFGSIRTFNRVFNQIMNMTPFDYRKMQKEEHRE